MDKNLMISELQRQTASLVKRLRRVILEKMLHDENVCPVSIPELGEYLSWEFRSDCLVLAVIHKRPNPLLKQTSVFLEDQSPMIQYAPEALTLIDELLGTFFLPQTQVITFRADRDVGIIINPDAAYISEHSMLDGIYYKNLLGLMDAFLRELDQRLGYKNMITVSAMRQGKVCIRNMYLETKRTFDYSWNTEDAVRAYPSLQIQPFCAEDVREMNALEQEFMEDLNHLLFLEASLVLDQIMKMQFLRRVPLVEIIVAVVARLRNVVAALECSVGLSPSVLNDISSAVEKVTRSSSVPELQDRVHDFFALISKISPRPPIKKSQQILEFIETNYKNPALSAQMICDQLRISKSYLSRILQIETGSGLVELIHNIRIQHAKQLLSETGMKIEQIAIQSGFTNRFGLLRAFKQIEGCSPSEYRNLLLHKGTKQQ